MKAPATAAVEYYELRSCRIMLLCITISRDIARAVAINSDLPCERAPVTAVVIGVCMAQLRKKAVATRMASR